MACIAPGQARQAETKLNPLSRSEQCGAGLGFGHDRPEATMSRHRCGALGVSMIGTGPNWHQQLHIVSLLYPVSKIQLNQRLNCSVEKK